MKYLFTFLVIVPTMALGQTKQDTLWMPFKIFAGTWTGDSDGKPGKGKYERTYEFVMNKKYIEVKNKSTYPPSQNHPMARCTKIMDS